AARFLYNPRTSGRVSLSPGGLALPPRSFPSWSLVLVALILGACLVASTVIAANTVQYVKTLDSSLLTVTGSTQQIITSDEVRWVGAFTRQTPAADLPDGYRQMQSDQGIVARFLADQGVPAAQITIGPVLVTPIQEQCGNPPRAGCANA